MDVWSLHDLLRRFAWARLAIAGLLLAAGGLLSWRAALAINVESFAAALLIIAGSSAAVLIVRPARARAPIVARLILGLDVAIGTLIVMATGGPRSIFTFLYVLVVIASVVLLSRQGALVIAGASSLTYTGVVLGRTVFPLVNIVEAATETTALEVLTMFLNTGTFLVVAIIAGDLAERYRSARYALEDQRKDLSDLQAFTDLVFDSVGTGLIGLDHDRRITAFNRAAEEITGVPAGQAMGQPWETVFGNAVALDDIEAAVRNDGRAFRRHELALRRPGRPDLPVALTFWALRSGGGDPVGIIAACEDLSSMKEMEARVRQADRLATVGRMAANIAHEIRNPLASLTGAIEVLAKDVALAPPQERLMQIVSRESERLNRFIKDFLEYARPAPPAMQPMNLADILDELLLLLAHRPLPGEIKVTREYGGALPVNGDPQQLRQVLWNLCLNAVDAMPGGGELRIGARLSRRRLQVWVADTGPGIPDADLPHIFEPFFSTKPGGTGIGLALAHRIMHEHGGDIDVGSVPGVGATFTIALPATNA